MARVKLESNEVINTPHMVATLAIAYANNEDDEDRRAELVETLATGFSPERDRDFFRGVFRQLLAGNIPYTVEGGATVVFDTRDETPFR